ncbi:MULTISPECIES: nucleotide-binding domain-containing protein [Bacillus cereus group]|uniref:Adenylate/guanylate cyclase domain-containing protein n=1 Tax=Bacillus cereus TaxID=1396 RepID=A0AB34D160_BACCE|nr:MULTISPECIES: adenylate/guanylate cyclase domain-containing protein [Bacillus cereus group]KAB2491398.1 adenylate/guanylate cyclase domain-containing protein [Bacillus cereus]MBG9532945.1 guanylate cyclase [Bacillus thuringiensis]NCA64979.1 guanylate cyclase [Bacillus cereus]
MTEMRQVFKELFEKNLEIKTLSESYEAFEKSASKQESPPIHQLEMLIGSKGKYFSDSIGTHPDFLDLKEGEQRYQYICSVFVDISGSTRLGLKFPLEKVKFYKNAILRSAIEIFRLFGAHIHRLQGDALFAYFGHKALKKSDAVIQALNAATFLQEFNRTALTEFFEENGLEPLKIRIGVDIGNDEQVLWSHYGIGNVTEVTTTSLHTDLAAKLQHKANGNGIMIGENVYTFLDLPKEFYEVKKFVSGGEEVNDYYIVQQPNYSMRLFKWKEYLETFLYMPKSGEQNNGRLKLVCEVEENGIWNEYACNSRALDKQLNLRFTVIIHPSIKHMVQNVKWSVENHGEEASAENALFYRMESMDGKNVCQQSTLYNGYHNMICEIYDRYGKVIGLERFGVFIHNDIRPFKNLLPTLTLKEGEPDYVTT